MKRDIVLPYKGMGTDELTYALLSLKNVEHRKLHIVDSVPQTAVIIPPINPFADVENKLCYAMTELGVSEEFILWNDDFFAMHYVNDIPALHRGYLKDVLDRRPHDSYRKALSDTYEYLIKAGIDRPLCYELHMPMVFNTSKRLAYSLLVRPEMQAGKKLLMRSVYGNLEGIGGTYTPDCKDVQDYEWYTFLSTSNKAWNGPIGEYIREKLK